MKTLRSFHLPLIGVVAAFCAAGVAVYSQQRTLLDPSQVAGMPMQPDGTGYLTYTPPPFRGGVALYGPNTSVICTRMSGCMVTVLLPTSLQAGACSGVPGQTAIDYGVLYQDPFGYQYICMPNDRTQTPVTINLSEIAYPGAIWRSSAPWSASW